MSSVELKPNRKKTDTVYINVRQRGKKGSISTTCYGAKAEQVMERIREAISASRTSDASVVPSSPG